MRYQKTVPETYLLIRTSFCHVIRFKNLKFFCFWHRLYLREVRERWAIPKVSISLFAHLARHIIGLTARMRGHARKNVPTDPRAKTESNISVSVELWRGRETLVFRVLPPSKLSRSKVLVCILNWHKSSKSYEPKPSFSVLQQIHALTISFLHFDRVFIGKLADNYKINEAISKFGK